MSSNEKLDISLEVYNERELAYLDKYLPFVKTAYDVYIIYNI